MSEKDIPVIKFSRKIGKVGDSIRITIPKEITDALVIEEGQIMEIYAVDNDTIIMKRMK
ncbi:MAG: AbrB/MazE/SpoVT family DNA-binding domain-containing protein [Candidatus Heimdallarchaeota archaeon]